MKNIFAFIIFSFLLINSVSAQNCSPIVLNGPTMMQPSCPTSTCRNYMTEIDVEAHIQLPVNVNGGEIRIQGDDQIVNIRIDSAEFTLIEFTDTMSWDLNSIVVIGGNWTSNMTIAIGVDAFTTIQVEIVEATSPNPIFQGEREVTCNLSTSIEEQVQTKEVEYQYFNYPSLKITDQPIPNSFSKKIVKF